MERAMTTKMRWFKFYAGDWSSDTQGMSAAAKGVYIDMLCMQWNGRRLPASVEELAAIFPDVTAKVYRELLQHFDEVDGWLINERLEEEREDAKSRSKNGKEAARKKWQSQPSCGGNAKSDAPALPIRMDQQSLSHCYSDTEAEAETEEDEESDADGCSAPRKARAKPRDTIGWSIEHGWSGITDRDREDWAVAYPLVNIDQDLAKAHQHLLSNPAKQAKKLWRKFLTNWFNRTQEGGGSREAGNAPARRGPPTGHIPPDAHPDEHYKWYMTNGWTPRQIPIYRTADGRERWLNGDYIDEETSQEHADENDE